MYHPLPDEIVRARWAGWQNIPIPAIPAARFRANLSSTAAEAIFQTFDTEQIFQDWQFQNGSSRVAYSTGPTHGGAAECVLRDVETGKLLDHWYPKEGGKAPDWAANLRI